MTIIAIDGTFASGKGTLGKGLAAHYGLPYLDTGKLYRATAKAVLDFGGDVENADDGARGAKSIAAENLSDPILKSGPIGAASPPVRKSAPPAAMPNSRAMAKPSLSRMSLRNSSSAIRVTARARLLR